MVRFYVLPQTYRGAGTPGSPDRGQAKDWRCNGAGLRFGDTSVRSTLEKEATTNGGLPSQLLLCPIFPGLCFHSINLCLGRVRDVNHSMLVPGICVHPCKGDEDKADLVLGFASCRQRNQISRLLSTNLWALTALFSTWAEVPLFSPVWSHREAIAAG